VAYQNDLVGIEDLEQYYTTYPEAILQWNVAVEVVKINLFRLLFLRALKQGNVIAKSFNVSVVKESGAAAHDLNSSASSKTGLLPILWHTLDVWISKDHGKGMLHSAITDLLKCDTEFSPDQW